MPRTTRITAKTVLDRYDLKRLVALMAGMEKLGDDEYVAIEGQLKVYTEDDDTGDRTDLIGTISFDRSVGYNIPQFVVPR